MRLLRKVTRSWSDLLQSEDRLSQRTDAWLKSPRAADRAQPPASNPS
jgi:hypothetical protein